MYYSAIVWLGQECSALELSGQSISKCSKKINKNIPLNSMLEACRPHWDDVYTRSWVVDLKKRRQLRRYGHKARSRTL